MKYRREIDGLRALAVAPIILFHSGLEIFKGGYLGVDIFFVISGYLITSILLRDLQQDRFSLANFYERRARRILPALFLVMGVCLLIAPFVMLPAEMKAFAKSLIAVSTFSSNFLFWREIGYFDISGHLKPLLHTWSLAVEEQFYLVYPVFLLVVWKWARSRLALLLAGIALTSLTVGHWAAFHRPGADFYLLPTRSWELLMGGLAGYYLHQKEETPGSGAAAGTLGFGGLVLIVASMCMFSANTPHPSAYTLVPAFGATLVILFAWHDNVAGRILSNPLAVGLGLISYSAYLWHHSIFALVRLHSVSEPSSWLMSLLCALVIVLAYLSWRLVETPFRDKSLIGKRWVVIAALTGSVAFLTAGIAGYASNGFERSYLMTLDDRQAKVWLASADKPNDIGCRFPTSEINAEIEVRFNQCAREYGKALVVLGDSHAIDMYQAISLNLPYPFVVGLVQGGCRPHSPDPDCHLESFRSFIEGHGQNISKVLYNQAGFPLLTEHRASAGDQDHHNAGAISYVPELNKVTITLDYLRSIPATVDVTWMGPSLEPNHNVKLVRKLAMTCNITDVAINTELDRGLKRLDREMAELVKSLASHVSYFSIIDALNFNKEVDIYNCDAIFWTNGDHWSIAGERRFGARIVEKLREEKVINH